MWIKSRGMNTFSRHCKWPSLLHSHRVDKPDVTEEPGMGTSFSLHWLHFIKFIMAWPSAHRVLLLMLKNRGPCWKSWRGWGIRLSQISGLMTEGSLNYINKQQQLVKSNHILFVTCAEYNRCRPCREMLTYSEEIKYFIHCRFGRIPTYKACRGL